MKLTREDRAALKASFKEMGLGKKIEYLYMYFKLPILLGLVALVLVCSLVYRHVTKKDVVLYSAHVNVAVGDALASYLDTDFIAALGENPKKAEVYLSQGLYLSNSASQEDHQYSYASRLRIMSSSEAKELDVVLMNQEAYDIFSYSGWLCDLPDLLAENAALYGRLEPCLTTNTVVLEDNAVEYQLGEADRYEATTRESVNGLDLSTLPVFDQAGFPGKVYLGVVANSPRLTTAVQYIEYLADEPQS